jgi:hypothetical protein
LDRTDLVEREILGGLGHAAVLDEHEPSVRRHDNPRARAVEASGYPLDRFTLPEMLRQFLKLTLCPGFRLH